MAGKGEVDEMDVHFLYHMTALVGSNAVVTTKTGQVYEGVYVAFSSNMEVVLEAAYLVREEQKGNDRARILEHFDVVTIASNMVASIKMTDVDMSYATKDFATDGAISGGRGKASKKKELTPWEGDEVDSSKDFSLLGSGSSPGKGWEAKDMFKQNQEKYGVVSTFSPDLKGYTTPVNKRDKKFKKLEEQASQIAQQIEKRPKKWELGNDDEESAYSAVIRPPNPKTPPNNSKRPIPPPPSKNYQPPQSCPTARVRNPPPSKSPPSPGSAQPPSKNPKASAQGPSQPPSDGVKLPSPALGDTKVKKVSKSMFKLSPDPIYYRPGIINFDTRRPPPPDQQGKIDPRGQPPPTIDRKPSNSPRTVKHVKFDLQEEPVTQNEFKKPFTLPSLDSAQTPKPKPFSITIAPARPQKGGPSAGDAVLGTQASRRKQSTPSPSTTPVPFPKVKKDEPPPTSGRTPFSKIVAPPPSAAKSLKGTVPPGISCAAKPAARMASPKVYPPKKPAVVKDPGNQTPPYYISGVDSPASPDPPTTNAAEIGEDAEVNKALVFNPNAKEFSPVSFANSPRSPSPPSHPSTGPLPMITQIPEHARGASALHFAEMPTFFAITPPPTSPMSSDDTVSSPPQHQITAPIPIRGTPAEPIQAQGPVTPTAPYFAAHFQTRMMQVLPQVRALPVIQAQTWNGAQVPHFVFLRAPSNGASPPNLATCPLNRQMAGPPNPWTAPQPRDNPWFHHPN